MVAARPRLREDPVVRRQQIVDEAIRVIGQHGFNGFTIQRLAAQCGLSNAGLLHYFGSKDALLIALLDEIERQETEILAPLVATARMVGDGSATALAARMQALRTIVARFAERPEVGRFTTTLQSEALDATHPAHIWFRERQQAALKLFEDMVEGFVPQPHATAQLLFALMNGLELIWLRADKNFDLLTAWDEGVGRLVIRGERR
jgi:AcrR family transcriptional regulator